MTTGKEKMLDNYIKIYGPTMNVQQVARVLHINPGSLRNLIYADNTPIPIYKVGRHYLADTASLVEYIENQKSSH